MSTDVLFDRELVLIPGRIRVYCWEFPRTAFPHPLVLGKQPIGFYAIEEIELPTSPYFAEMGGMIAGRRGLSSLGGWAERFAFAGA